MTEINDLNEIIVKIVTPLKPWDDPPGALVNHFTYIKLSLVSLVKFDHTARIEFKNKNSLKNANDNRSEVKTTLQQLSQKLKSRRICNCDADR